MKPLTNEQLQEILDTIDLEDNGQETISKLSDDTVLSFHNGLSKMSEQDKGYRDTKEHKRIIEDELRKRNISFEPLS